MRRNLLTQADLFMFERLKIPPELLEAAGIERVTDREARDKYGIVGGGDMAGIVFPYFHPKTGRRTTVRLRRDNPEIRDGKPQKKYVSPYGERKHLYFPPGAGEFLHDPSIPIVAVEAEKSVMAGMSWAQRAERRALFIGTGGCWGWTGRIGKKDNASGKRVDEKGPLPDLDLISWLNRDVTIMFDANTATNVRVRQARLALAKELMTRGARVRVGDLPAVPGVNGPDDLVAVCGDWSIATLLETAGSLADVAITEAEAMVTELETNAEACRRGDQKNTFVALAAVDDDERREILVGRAARAFGRLLPKEMIRNAIKRLRQQRKEVTESIAKESRQSSLRKREVLPAALVDELETFFAERAYLPPGAALVLAYWSLNTWCYECFDTVPFLNLESAVPGCGKTTVLERLLGAVCAQAVLVADMTEATFFRVIDGQRPTLLVDEAELLEGRSDKAQALRAIAHAGYKKGGKVPRCDGDEHEVRWFSVFCPQAYALIGGVTGALLDRCITIHMEKAPLSGNFRKSTKLKSVIRAAAPLREELEAYSLQFADRLAELYNAAPDQGHWPHIRDREAELWEPLLFHARVAGPNMEARLLDVIGTFSRQKANIQGDDWRVAQIIALLEAIGAHTESTFSPGDLVEALGSSDAWAQTFAKYKSGDEGKKAKAAAIGRVLGRFRLASRTPTKLGITYRTDDAIANLSAHVPAESLTSSTLSPGQTFIRTTIENTGLVGSNGMGKEDGSRPEDTMKDHTKPNGRAGRYMEFEL